MARQRPGIGWCSPAGAVGSNTEARLGRGEEPEWETEPLEVEDVIGRSLTWAVPGLRGASSSGPHPARPEFFQLVDVLLEQAPSVQGALHWTPRNSDHQS